jgi:voltage-gated potassium channel
MIRADIFKKLYLSGLGLLITVLTGTFGYWFIFEKQYSIFDCFFMTFITITTIGFGEVLPLQDYTGARMFTVLIAMAGIGFITYFVSTFAAIIIEGYIRQNYQKSKMDKTINQLEGHYIVCGINPYTGKVIEELSQTNRKYIIIDPDSEKLQKIHALYKSEFHIEGDPTEDENLKKAHIDRSIGVFAATEEDNINLVISLSVRRLNPKVRVIAFCFDPKNAEKMELAGADKVVSPTNIGGMRMASEMIRPTVTNFLDFMLREDSKTYRIEEVIISEEYHGKNMKEIDVSNLKSTIIMAVKNKDKWIFKPGDDCVICEGDVLIVMTTPEERIKLEKDLST